VPSVLWRCWLGGRKGIRPVKTEWWGAGMVICLEWGADLLMAQLMPLSLTVSCFSKIQIGFTFLVLSHLGSPGKGPVNGCCCLFFSYRLIRWLIARSLGIKTKYIELLYAWDTWTDCCVAGLFTRRSSLMEQESYSRSLAGRVCVCIVCCLVIMHHAVSFQQQQQFQGMSDTFGVICLLCPPP